jgi:glycosyltransferase involved in cell wall biosynthesis
MKLVVHLSTHDKMGGAAIAAWRLHQGLQQLGVESRMISRTRSWPGPDVSCIASELFEASELYHRHRVRPAQAPEATFFSFTPTSIPLLDHPWIAAADVVHLHWVAKFLSPEDIAPLCEAGKTVFWTFHDQWPYTGGCHYIGGSRRLEADWNGTAQIDESLHALARMELERKKRIFGSLPIHVIAPSRWMAAEAAASGIFPTERIHVLPSGLDPAVYHHAGDEVAEDGVTLLFGCQSLAERRKGYQELRQAFNLCMNDARFAAAASDGLIRLRTFGSVAAKGMDLPIPVKHLGKIDEGNAIADILRSSSAFLCPTLDDNLPNVVMESLACGNPVIAFDTGGVPDMVTHQMNGLLAAKGDIAGLARHLTDFCLDSSLRKRLREGARRMDVSQWTLETQARRVFALYETLRPASPADANSPLPEPLPVLNMEGGIHPHFAVEMTRTLMGRIHEQGEHFKQQDYTLRKQIKDARGEAEVALQRLENEKAAHQAIRARLWETKDKLQVETQQRKDAQNSLKASKQQVQSLKQDMVSLKQQLLKQRPVYVRVWRSLRKRLRNAQGAGTMTHDNTLAAGKEVPSGKSADASKINPDSPRR